jgi:2,4-dienoyl-CoA reductase-like NADH-dependent reductase (Old Yellow Enzyme family)
MNSVLFQPFRLHDRTLPNRIVLAPMTRPGPGPLVDGLAFGFHQLGEPMTPAEFRKVFHGPLIGNCGYTKETAVKAIAEGHAELISFGRPCISNPDFVDRFRNGRRSAELAPMPDWYSPTGAKGYTDFPAYET